MDSNFTKMSLLAFGFSRAKNEQNVCSQTSVENVPVQAENHLKSEKLSTPGGCLSDSCDLGSKESGPNQPKLESFPSIIVCGKKRKFSSDWFQLFPWLEYSVEKDSAFCFSCRQFPQLSGCMEKNFTEVGINQWRKALEKFRIHQESDFHKNSFIRWQSFVQMEKDGSVLCKMSSLHSQTVADNREYLAKVVKVLIFLARQGVALRGDNEKDDSKNKGNFLELCSLVSDFDPSFSDQISKLAKNATYLSAQIQNELIGVTANVIRNQISSEIQEAGMATIIVDETKDCSKKEQMSICVRYVTFSEQTGHTVKEEFLQFREADGLDADSLCQQISKEIETLGLNNVSVVAQCYDGASVMSGHLSGVQTRFREKYPNAVYVHCYAHRLNLALVAVCGSVKSAGEFFALVESLYVFLSRSIVHKEFVEIQQSNEVRVKELVRLSDTRWSCRYQSLSTMKSRFKCIVEVLEFFSNASVNYSSPTLAVEAKGLLCQVLSVSFITHLEILTDLLSHSHCLSEMLQKSDLNLASAEVLVRSVIDSLDEKREKGWTELWKFINLQCDECDIHVPETLKPSGKRKRVANRAFQDSIVMTSTGQRDQPEEYSEFVRVHTYLELLDRFKAELERRFSSSSLGLMKGVDSLLRFSSPTFLDYNVISKFIATYSDTLDIDADLLKAELAIAAKIPIKTNQVRDHQEFAVLEKTIPYRTLPTLHRAVKLALTLPVSTATCERSFSSLKYIKNYLRNKMSNQRLSDLGVIYLSPERSKVLLDNPSEVVSMFSKRSTRLALH